LDNPRVRPYLEPQDDFSVLMRAPVVSHMVMVHPAYTDQDLSRPQHPKPPHLYSFDRVFQPTTPQSAFFNQTTLPLVEKLLQGENGLAFAYGVSNSGKT
jgi:kinesin family protein 20